MRKSKTITIKVRGYDLDEMERIMNMDNMDEDELFSCLIRMSAPLYCVDSEELTDEQAGHMIRRARRIFLDCLREVIV